MAGFEVITEAMPADQSGWFDNQQCTTPVEPRSQLGEYNLSAGVVGIAFFSRSRNRANCLRKNNFSAAGAVRRRHTAAKKLKPSLTIARRFRTILERRVKTLNIVQSSHANSINSDSDRIFASDRHLVQHETGTPALSLLDDRSTASPRT